MEPNLLETLAPFALWTAIGACGAVAIVALVRGGGYPFRRLGEAFARALSGAGEGDGELAPRDATLVTASLTALPVVAGTATAIATGGPGSVLWLWIAALVLAAVRWLDAGLAFRHGGAQTGARGAVEALLGKRFAAGALFYSFAGIGAAAVAGSALVGRSVAEAAGAAGWSGAAFAWGAGAAGVLIALAGAARVVGVTRLAAVVALAMIAGAGIAASVAHPD